MSRNDNWKPYVSVAKRRARAAKQMAKLRKKGLDVQPVEIEGRKIARTFWGEAWCEHLESFSDYENRLPRGRTYVRNGSVCHLAVSQGEVNAMVNGSRLYNVKIEIKTLAKKKWQRLKEQCSGEIGSLIELLQGRLSKNVMRVVTDSQKGLFPHPKEIGLSCNCPDWATMCKHVAAVLYGVGARLDEKPELLFRLRGVDQNELIGAGIDVKSATEKARGGRRRIADDALAGVFGIDLPDNENLTQPKPRGRPKTKKVPKSKKASAPRKKAKKVSPRTAQKSGPITGKSITNLREKFAMTKSEFAMLLDVSGSTIGSWEKKASKTLRLQPRSLEAWTSAKKLSKRKAWAQLNKP